MSHKVGSSRKMSENVEVPQNTYKSCSMVVEIHFLGDKAGVILKGTILLNFETFKQSSFALLTHCQLERGNS